MFIDNKKKMSSKNNFTQKPQTNTPRSSKNQITPHLLRKNTHDLIKLSGDRSNSKLVKRCDSDGVLNTAFSLPSSVSKTPVRSSDQTQKISSTTLNACYTPSSLFRSTTPKSRIVTPKQLSSNRTPKITPRAQNNFQKTPECFSKVNLDSPKKYGKSNNVTTDNKTEDKGGEISNLKVAVRVRPLNAQECLNSSVTNIIRIEDNLVEVFSGTTADNSAGVCHSFQYDNAFWSVNSDDKHYASQDVVFKNIGRPLVEKAFEGYNACLFAYGQTGSGKSFSMMGIETDENYDISSNSEAGIIPRFCREIFHKISKLSNVQAEVEISYFEIYNEKIHDLLSVSQQTIDGNLANHSGKKNCLRVREHPIWGPYVVGLSTHPVNCYKSLRNWLAVGNSQRATAATGMNDQSSRSHSIFNIVLSLSEIEETQNDTIKFKETKRSKVSLVDLAGSERISNMEMNGDRIREGVCINKSLLTLGKVIAALANDSKRGTTFVPYRESILTWLLRENLGGNSRTVMLATISPASIHLDETLATLRYACQARAVVNRVKVNEDPHDRIIRELRAEVERLKALRQDYERQKRHSNSMSQQSRKIVIETSVDENEIEALRLQLAETEKELSKAQKSWMERLKEAENLRKFEIRTLKRKGLALELSAEQKQPCLVNLAADPILSGILLYILPPGIVRIGRSKPSSACQQPDIVLDGPLVAHTHCSIENLNGNLYLIPENYDFETFLNGELVQEKKQIYDGDRLVIGGTHYFRVSNPFCIKRNQNVDKTKIIDYQLAHQEILQKQEEQLRNELDEEKKIALAQIELERAEYERNYREKYELLELEKFKFNCTKELLETEKKALQDKHKNDDKFEYTPHKSTLLDDIKKIMQHPTKDSLHKTQLMVKEATQRCRDIGCNLEFKHSEIVDEFGIFRSVIIIIDRLNERKAEWPVARLRIWLDILRDNNDNINSDNLFNSVDIEWLPYDNNNLDDTANMNESILNSSRISLNLNAMKNIIFNRQKTNTNKLNTSGSDHKIKIEEEEEEEEEQSLQYTTTKNNNDFVNSFNSENSKNMINISHQNKKNEDNNENWKNIKKKLTYDNDDDDDGNNYDKNDKKYSNRLSSTINNNYDLNSSIQNTKDTSNNFNLTALIHLKDIRKNTLKLKKLCNQFAVSSTSSSSINDNNIKKSNISIEDFKKSIEQIDNIIYDLKNKLNYNENLSSATKTPKSVRFLLD